MDITDEEEMKAYYETYQKNVVAQMKPNLPLRNRMIGLGREGDKYGYF